MLSAPQAVQDTTTVSKAVFADWSLIGLCICFFIGTLAVSFLPFMIRYHNEYQVRCYGPQVGCCASIIITTTHIHHQSQVISVLGAGLLTGAALQIIIPEGFSSIVPHPPHEADPITPNQAPHWLAGFVLTLGFLTMLIIDHLQTHCIQIPWCHSSDDLHRVSSRDDLLPSTALDVPTNHHSTQHGANTSTITTAGSPSRTAKDHTRAASRVVIGLLIHAAADGLSLGAASLTGDHSMELVVALAMILHKVPVAMGLAAYLQSTRIPWRTTQRWLVMFSAMMPVSTLITYWLLAAVPGAQQDGGVVVPLCLLFSGGTVLYAATMHILPEIMSAASAGAGGGAQHLSMSHMVLFVVGAIAPLGLTLLPEHD